MNQEPETQSADSTWNEISADYTKAYWDRKLERPGSEFELAVSVILLGYDVVWRWALEITEAFGIPYEWCWRDPQFHGAFIIDDEDELMHLAVDSSDLSDIKLTWTAVLALGSDPQPLPDFSTAYEAARTYLTPMKDTIGSR